MSSDEEQSGDEVEDRDAIRNELFQDDDDDNVSAPVGHRMLFRNNRCTGIICCFMKIYISAENFDSTLYI